MLFAIKKLVFAVCVVAVVNQVWAKPVLVTSEQNIYEYKLDNGFRVVLAPNAKENKVFMNTIYFTGSLNDPEGKGGLAHLLEHLAFKGTQNIQGEEFQRLLDQYTLSNNASTNYYSTKYTNIIRPDQTALANIIHLEAERMDKLVLQEHFVPSEIEIVRREREVRLDQPFAVMMDKMWKAAYGNQSLGRLPIGDLDELKSIKMPELEKFYRAYYAPNNAVMVVAGKFDVQAVLADIEKNFSSIAAREIATSAQVPILDASTIGPRTFTVQKGSDLAKFHIYLNGKNREIQPALQLIPYLYTMQPSGHLYQNLVQKGISTDIAGMTWLEQDFNLVFLGAIYAPTQDATKVEHALTQQVEQGQAFSEIELQRVKNLFQNAHKKMLTDAVQVGSTLSEYIVSDAGDWKQFFAEQRAVQQLSLAQTNQTLQQFLIATHRVQGDIQPTPEEQKQAVQQQMQHAEQQTQALEQAAPLKDVSVYKQEVKDFVQQSAKLLGASEHKIQRGQLGNGMKYALLPTATRDDRIYASISLDFGTAQSLQNQGQTIDLMSYLLLRGSDKQTLQQITDKSIALDGSATTTHSANTLHININAPKENFKAYFAYIVEILKHPKFEQKEFELIQAQSLQSLDRPYTEPEVVAGLTLSRLTEQYQTGDLRYHFEPELTKQQLEHVRYSDIRDFYRQYFAMNHARVSVTGEFDDKAMLKQLKKYFAHWSSEQHYVPVLPDYKQYQAQQQHVLAEQREFGSYQSVLTLPVGIYHPDAAALLVFSHILGDSQLSSRLGKELREKNALVYGFASQLNLNDQKNVGMLQIDANYTAGRAAQVSQAVHKVLSELLEKGVTEQELEAAKADIMKQRATMLEDERNVHWILNHQLKLDKTMASRAYRDVEIAKLTRKDIHTVMQKYIKPEQFVEVMADQYGKAQ
jgi:zinc protease